MSKRNEIEAMSIICNIQAMQQTIHGEYFEHASFAGNTVDELRELQSSLIPLYNKALAENKDLSYSFNQNDNNYRNAVNYDGTNYHNCPMTFEIKSTLFILPFGSMDSKQVKIDGNTVYIIAENSPLNYISMVVIDLTELTDKGINTCHIAGNDIDDTESPCFEIFDKDLDEQIKILSNYIS